MPDMRMDVDGDEVLRRINSFLGEQLPAGIKDALEKACYIVEADAKRNCPTDDGRLKNSITHQVEGNRADIGSNVFYAPYVHQGTGLYALEGNGRKNVPWHYQDENGQWHTTSGQEPNPFLQNAVDTNRDNILKQFQGVLGDGRG